MSRVGAIIEARMSSSRLPGKVLMKINKRPVLDLLIERIKFVNEIDQIIVATTTSKKDDILEEYCNANNIICYRGSEENVMQRVLEAAKKKNIRLIQTSTSEVYGTAKYTPIDENHPMQGQSPYSASKIAADYLSMSYFYSFNRCFIIYIYHFLLFNE